MDYACAMIARARRTGDRHLLGLGLAHLQVDGEGDELAVLLDQVLDLVLLEELAGVLLQEELDLGAAAQGVAAGVLGHGEVGVGGRLPDVLLVVVVLRGDLHLVRDEVDRVEADAELADERDVGARREGLDELGCPGPGDGAQVLDEVLLGHADTAVADRQGALLLVEANQDLGLLVVALAEHGLVLQRHEADLVQGIGPVRDQLAEEDVLLLVQGVDDDVHQPGDLGLELELLHVLLQGLLLGVVHLAGHAGRGGGVVAGRRRGVLLGDHAHRGGEEREKRECDKNPHGLLL